MYYDLEKYIDQVFAPQQSIYRNNSFALPNSFESGGAIDLSENDNELLLTMELPGLGKEDIELKLEENILSIQAERNLSKEEKDKSFRLSERRSYKVQRSIRLPQAVKESEIDAKLENGVLRVVLPKAENTKLKQISVK